MLAKNYFPRAFLSTLLTLCRVNLISLSIPEFPPRIIISEDENFLTGHLQPLGHQCSPSGAVKEFTEAVRPEEFWEKHVNLSVPLVLRQGIGKSPALNTWINDDYLRDSYGELDVLIELKEEDRAHSTRRMNISEFLSRYKHEDIYAVSLLPDPMRKEIQVPHCLLCGSFLDYIHETNFWMSSGGTRSVIHYDADHNLHCLVSGRKDFIMIERKYAEDLYFFEMKEYSGSSFSGIDPNSVDLVEFPHVAKVPWTYATLRPGDCIYIPAEYIHQVRSYKRTISATILFTSGPLLDTPFKPEGCNETLNYTPLSDVEVHWTYQKRDAYIEMGYMNVEVMRHSLLATMKERNEENLTKEAFVEFWGDYEEQPYEYHDDNIKEDPRVTFEKYLDKKHKGFVTKEDILNIPRETLKALARLVDVPHGPQAKTENGAKLDKKLAVHEDL